MNRHNLLLARHAANEYRGWLKIVNCFALSHKLMRLASIEIDLIKMSHLRQPKVISVVTVDKSRF